MEQYRLQWSTSIESTASANLTLLLHERWEQVGFATSAVPNSRSPFMQPAQKGLAAMQTRDVTDLHELRTFADSLRT
jgi:hypothetical protein